MNYKEYKMANLGFSDIASLTVRFPNSAELLNFGEDGFYSAYVVDQNAEIGEHYHLVAKGHYWVHIYDDRELTFARYADEIRIYRAGTFGVIVQLIGERNR